MASVAFVAAALLAPVLALRGIRARSHSAVSLRGSAGGGGHVLSAAGFGTVCGALTTWATDQNCEHQQITQRALRCSPTMVHREGAGDVPGSHGSARGPCFDALSSRVLAGYSDGAGSWGAVGTPDNPMAMLLWSDDAHCDNGDYLLGRSDTLQRRETAKSNIESCRRNMVELMHRAVDAAAPLVPCASSNAPLAVDAAQTLPAAAIEIPAGGADGLHFDVVFDSCHCTVSLYRKKYAKCEVLCLFGELLHASQDFYSHSNWVDQPSATEPISVTNPPGLGQAGIAPWLDIRTATPKVAFPDGLITGCFDLSAAGTLLGGTIKGDRGVCVGRISHETLNKDKGVIDAQTGHVATGTTGRGKLNNNFVAAVEAATEDTRDKWETLQTLLVRAYGDARGALMACALAKDDAAACSALAATAGAGACGAARTPPHSQQRPPRMDDAALGTWLKFPIIPESGSWTPTSTLSSRAVRLRCRPSGVFLTWLIPPTAAKRHGQWRGYARALRVHSTFCPRAQAAGGCVQLVIDNRYSLQDGFKKISTTSLFALKPAAGAGGPAAVAAFIDTLQNFRERCDAHNELLVRYERTVVGTLV